MPADPSLSLWAARAAKLDAAARTADTFERINRAELCCARSIELAAQSQKCVDATFKNIASTRTGDLPLGLLQNVPDTSA